MSRLFLLRHARAAWAEPGMRDFDRPLDPTGFDDADAIGATMHAEDLIPARVLCSGARRARETWERVSLHLRSVTDVTFTDSLYVSDATGYLSTIRDLPDAASVLLVGHNPMMEDLCFGLAADGDAGPRDALASGFPTCGLAVIDFSCALPEIAPGKGRLAAFHMPAALHE